MWAAAARVGGGLAARRLQQAATLATAASASAAVGVTAAASSEGLRDSPGTSTAFAHSWRFALEERSTDWLLEDDIPGPHVVLMGRGDKRTKRGKRFRHSYGKSRPHHTNKQRHLPTLPVRPVQPQLPAAGDAVAGPM
eukprot:jgi/Chlat1/2187/Chrsp17S02742